MKMKWTTMLFFPLVGFLGLFSSLQAAEPLPDTGQTKFYNNSVEIIEPASGEPFYGQDAHYMRDRSYTKLDADGNDLTDSTTSWSMVRDNVTGLIWEVKQAADGTVNYSNPHDADNIYTWYDSDPETNGGGVGTPGDGTDTEDYINALNAANYGNHNDWRLPTVKELSWLTDSSPHYGPTITMDFFSQTKPGRYWSSTAQAGSTGGAWYVDFRWNLISSCAKSEGYLVRAVRSEQPRSLEPLIDNSDGTVTDPNTGLMWQQTGPDKMIWQNALSYCENLDLAGHNDWRLPDRHELESLVDYSCYHPSIDETIFPDFTDPYLYAYWSSTTDAGEIQFAWLVDFFNGSINYGRKTVVYYVRAVRSGQSGPPPPINISPVLDPIGNKSCNEGELLEFTVTATDPDLADTLTFGADNLPEGATFNSDTATFSWTPGYDQAGNYENVEFSVEDNGDPMGIDAELITITIGNVNRAPEFTTIAPPSVDENEVLIFQVFVTDPDGDDFSLSSGELPPGANFNTTTGIFDWIPDYWMAGTYPVVFSATDDGDPNLTSDLEVVITVGDVDAPGEMTEEIIETVTSEALNLPQEVENSYLANLKKVSIFVDKNKLTPAINQLDAFISKVENDIIKGTIDAEMGNDLIDKATEIIQKITP